MLKPQKSSKQDIYYRKKTTSRAKTSVQKLFLMHSMQGCINLTETGMLFNPAKSFGLVADSAHTIVFVHYKLNDHKHNTMKQLLDYFMNRTAVFKATCCELDDSTNNTEGVGNPFNKLLCSLEPPLVPSLGLQ